MNNKRPLDNAPLSAMLFTGGALLVLGLIIRLANTDADPGGTYGGATDSSLVGQFFGSAIGSAGLLLLTLGWAASAICRQIADAAQRAEREKRP